MRWRGCAVVSRLFGSGWRFFVSFYVGIDLVAKNARENKHGTTAQLIARPLDLDIELEAARFIHLLHLLARGSSN